MQVAVCIDADYGQRAYCNLAFFNRELPAMLDVAHEWLRPWVGLSIAVAMAWVAVALPVVLHGRYQRFANRAAALRKVADQRPLVLDPPPWTGENQPLDRAAKRNVWIVSILMLLWLAYALARLRIV